MDLIHNLRKVLLENSSKEISQGLFNDLITGILDISGCSKCSLWTINNNSTNANGFQSASLIDRKLKKGLTYNFKHYVLDLTGTFFQKTIDNAHSYYIGCRSDHKLLDSIEALDLHCFIGIPVPDFTNKTQTIAILKLSYTTDPKIEQIELTETEIDNLAEV